MGGVRGGRGRKEGEGGEKGEGEEGGGERKKEGEVRMIQDKGGFEGKQKKSISNRVLIINRVSII